MEATQSNCRDLITHATTCSQLSNNLESNSMFLKSIKSSINNLFRYFLLLITLILCSVSSNAYANVWDATDLSAISKSTKNVILSWGPPTESTGLTKYQIFRNGVFIAEADTATFSYNDLNLQSSTKYFYTVITCYVNLGCQSTGPTAYVDTPAIQSTTAVSGLTVTTTATSSTLSWTIPTDANNQTEYRVYRDGSLVGIAISNSYKDINLKPKTNYSYQVLRCTTNAGCMSDGPRVSAITLEPYPSSPSSLTANVFGTNVDLSWTPSSDATLVSEYRVYRDGTQIGTSKSTSLADSKLKANTTYKYTVYACNAQAVCDPNGAQAVAVTENTTVAIPAIANEKAVTLAAKLIGEPSKPTLSVKVSIPESSLTSVFVAFLFYGQLTFLNNMNNWVPHIGNTPPEYQFLDKTPVELEIPIIKDTDLTPYKGGQLIVGYGKGLTPGGRWMSLVNNLTYQIVYEVGK